MKILLLLLMLSGCSVPEILAYQKLNIWYSKVVDSNLGHVEPVCTPQDSQHKQAVHCSEIENTKCTSCCDVCGNYRTE